MDMSNIKIIRGLWGDFENYKTEIPLIPLHNEKVYVWGDKNKNYLDNLGYDTFYMGENPSLPHQSFNLKIECLIMGESEYGEIIFIDWDVHQIKELDYFFYSELREQTFSMPTYSYPLEYLNLNENDWIKEIIGEFKKYGWVYGDMIVIPNAGFIYSNNSKVPQELKRIINEKSIKTLVEEFAMWCYSNCDLETYIKKYEPKCIYGRPNRTFKLGQIEKNTENDLHNIINGLLKKNIYFIHN